MRLIDVDKFLKMVKKDREHEIYLHSWTADMVLERLDSWYAPTVEAIPKVDYENRLKADMVAMLTEILLEAEENTVRWYVGRVDGKSDDVVLMETLQEIIRQKINALKGKSDASARHE